MVRLTDEGIFDAPLDKIWRFMNDDTTHHHKSVTFSKVLEQSDKHMIVELETKSDGKTIIKHKAKFTFNPPKGFDMEFLSGPQTGTKHTHTYTPMGNKTRVVVEGEFKIQGLDDQATKKAALAFLEQLFNEDNSALQKYK
ncbi:MAG: SRPBCC family protein [Candidatus Bathyarchaeia archaeon]|jgi:ligand-binding SRPBCC domain-containing protein